MYKHILNILTYPKIMKIKESMKRHTERRSPGGGGDGPGVYMTEKQSVGVGGGIIQTF
jgi:hypothetical protein